MTLPPLPDRPCISVVIPCRDEAGWIGRCLASLEAAEREAGAVTVLVCDGMSSDGSRDEIAAFTARLQWIKLLDNTDRTTPHALNLGLRHQPFDVGIILGAHAEVAPDFITRNIAALRADPTAGCAGGIITNAYADGRSRRIGRAMGHPFGVGGAHFRTGLRKGHVDTVAFGAYRREVFDAVGWFDAALVRNQDDEFNYRVTKAGFKILLDPSIRSRYHVRASYGKLFRQYHQYGYWKVYVNRLHGAVTTLRQLVPAGWVAYLVLGVVAVALQPALAPFAFAGVFLYLLAAIGSALHAGSGLRDLAGVLFAFVVLHVAYGVGYWQGILHFLVLRRDPSAGSQRMSR